MYLAPSVHRCILCFFFVQLTLLTGHISEQQCSSHIHSETEFSRVLSGVFRLAVRAGLNCWFAPTCEVCTVFCWPAVSLCFFHFSEEEEWLLGDARGECCQGVTYQHWRRNERSFFFLRQKFLALSFIFFFEK